MGFGVIILGFWGEMLGFGVKCWDFGAKPRYFTPYPRDLGTNSCHPGTDADCDPHPTEAAPPAPPGSGSGVGGTPDLRRQLGLLLQTAGRCQVERMLRELVREQGPGGARRGRRRATRSPRDGGGGRNRGWEPQIWGWNGRFGVGRCGLGVGSPKFGGWD